MKRVLIAAAALAAGCSVAIAQDMGPDDDMGGPPPGHGYGYSAPDDASPGSGDDGMDRNGMRMGGRGPGHGWMHDNRADAGGSMGPMGARHMRMMMRHMGMMGTGFTLKMGGGRELTVRCGEQTMAECVHGLAPLIGMIETLPPAPPPHGPHAPHGPKAPPPSPPPGHGPADHAPADQGAATPPPGAMPPPPASPDAGPAGPDDGPNAGPDAGRPPSADE